MLNELEPIQLNQFSSSYMEMGNDVFEIVDNTKLFEEAVFNNGLVTIEPIIAAFQKVKDVLDNLVKNGNDFSPLTLFNHESVKELEAIVKNIFGFKTVVIRPTLALANSKKAELRTKFFNAFTIKQMKSREPILALVTQDGFYDKYNSMKCIMIFSIGTIYELDAKELTAVLIHELGHNIDPALVNLKYLETNVISKYLTNRKPTREEINIMIILKKIIVPVAIDKLSYQVYKRFIYQYIMEITIIHIRSKLVRNVGVDILRLIITKIYKLIVNTIKTITYNEAKLTKKIQSKVKRDLNKFNVRMNQEAFADNFARMYGLGKELITALNKLSSKSDENYNPISLCNREKTREALIGEFVLYCTWDIHKTHIQRALNLINEYEADINDPNIPEEVKMNLREDLNELELVVKTMMNNPEDLTSRLNKVIYDVVMEDLENESEEPVNESITLDRAWKEFSNKYSREAIDSINNLTDDLSLSMYKFEAIDFTKLHDLFQDYMEGYLLYRTKNNIEEKTDDDIIYHAMNYMENVDNIQEPKKLFYNQAMKYVESYLEELEFMSKKVDDTQMKLVEAGASVENIGSVVKAANMFTEALNNMVIPVIDNLLWASGWNSKLKLNRPLSVKEESFVL